MRNNGKVIGDISEIYSNAAMINISAYEFEITLGLESVHYDGVKPILNIRMSPQFAKDFLKRLNEKVEQYEKNWE